jgi:Xaa-Pro aminopeptidase
VSDAVTLHHQRRLLGRPTFGVFETEADRRLADAMIEARLRHDDHALGRIRAAVDATVAAFAAGREAVAPGRREWEVKAAMEGAVAARGMGVSFNPIVSVHGEILHNETSAGFMSEGELLLVDFGAETGDGWAADVTRTWPVGTAASTTQQEMIAVVVAAQQAAISRCVVGARYRNVHLAAAREIAAGLVGLGVLTGDIDELVADGVHALFFPHGIGHLMGLDVHDMEDLGDPAGYAAGRTRDAQFGLAALRLDRDLEASMVVTIEPGIYLVPKILSDPELTKVAGDRLNRDVLAHFADVRGIRIEDDILVRPDGQAPEVLTAAIPKPR